MFKKAYYKLQTREGITLVASVALIIFTIAFIFGGFNRHDGMKKSGPDGMTPSITVNGTGEVFAIPDIAQFSFSVQKDAKTMAEAQNMVAEQGNAITEALKSAGIATEDIKTEGFNAYPKYENRVIAELRPCTSTYCPPSESNQVIVGYTVSHSYSVKVRDIEKASDIAKLITDANVFSVNGPDFTIDDQEALKNQARAKAIDDAKQQAQILSRQLGVRLDHIIDFQVVDGGYYPMYARTEMAYSSDAKAGMAPALEPGESSTKVNVSVTYRIRD